MAWQFLIVWVVTTVLSAMLTPKQKVQNARPGAFGQDIPYVTESSAIPVGWGTYWVTAANLTWWGNVRMTAIRRTTSKKG